MNRPSGHAGCRGLGPCATRAPPRRRCQLTALLRVPNRCAIVQPWHRRGVAQPDVVTVHQVEPDRPAKPAYNKVKVRALKLLKEMAK